MNKPSFIKEAEWERFCGWCMNEHAISPKTAGRIEVSHLWLKWDSLRERENRRLYEQYLQKR